MLATANTEEIRRGFEKNAGKWTGRVEISREEIPCGKRSIHDYNYIERLALCSHQMGL